MTSPISPELQSKVAMWRVKVADGTITEAEMKEAVSLLRQGRLAAAQASATVKRKKAMVAIPNADDLLAGLEGL
jgi:uncharacterized tellurite resistance protein B-like protein